MTQHLSYCNRRHAGSRQARSKRVPEIIGWKILKACLLQRSLPSLTTTLQWMPPIRETRKHPLGEIRTYQIAPPQQLRLAASGKWYRPSTRRRLARSYLYDVIQEFNVGPLQTTHLAGSHSGFDSENRHDPNARGSHGQQLFLLRPREDVRLAPLPTLVDEELPKVERAPRKISLPFRLLEYLSQKSQVPVHGCSFYAIVTPREFEPVYACC